MKTKKPPATIDILLKKLTKTLDSELNDRRAMSQGAMVDVGYFELRGLIQYMQAQHDNLVALERITNTIVEQAGQFTQRPLEWKTK